MESLKGLFWDPFLLFLIYINDLPNCITNSVVSKFADDTTLTASGKHVPEIE